MIRQYFGCKNYDEAESARCLLACTLPSLVTVSMLNVSVLTATEQRLGKSSENHFTSVWLVIFLCIAIGFTGFITDSNSMRLGVLTICIILVTSFMFIRYQKNRRRVLWSKHFAERHEFIMVIEYMPDMKSSIAQALSFFSDIKPI